MKKILIITALVLCSIQGFAQKTLEIYNFTSQTITITNLTTSASGAYPEFHTKPGGFITIAPGDTYVMQNTANVYRFPFLSPSSSPAIGTWERMTSPLPGTNMSSSAAWVLGNNQVFDRLQLENGTIFNATDGYMDVGGYEIIYDFFQDGNVILYTVMFLEP